MALCVIETTQMEIEMQVKITSGELVDVKDFAEASAACRAFLDEMNIGNSEWSGGPLWDGNKQIGYVSFNGKVWAGRSKDWQVGMKPLYNPYEQVAA